MVNTVRIMRILNKVADICQSSSNAISEKKKPFDKYFLLGEAYAFREAIGIILRELEESEEGDEDYDEEILQVYFENPEAAEEEP